MCQQCFSFTEKIMFCHTQKKKQLFMLPNVCANLSQIVGPLPSTLTAPSYYQQKKHDFKKTYSIIYIRTTLRICTQNLLIVGLIHWLRKLERILVHIPSPHLLNVKSSFLNEGEPCLCIEWCTSTMFSVFLEYNVECVMYIVYMYYYWVHFGSSMDRSSYCSSFMVDWFCLLNIKRNMYCKR